MKFWSGLLPRKIQLKYSYMCSFTYVFCLSVTGVGVLAPFMIEIKGVGKTVLQRGLLKQKLDPSREPSPLWKRMDLAPEGLQAQQFLNYWVGVHPFFFLFSLPRVC